MNVQVWVGRQPTDYEAEALRQLHTSLVRINASCHLMANFLVDGTEIDLFAAKPDGLFLIELKKVHGPVTGAINGTWTSQNGSGTYPLNGGRGKNPYQQMTGQFYALANWMERHKSGFLSEYDAQNTWFWPDRDDPDAGTRVDIRSLLTFYPDLPDGSRLDLDWKVEAIGFPELPQILATEDTRLANFTEDAIVRLARALNLRSWTALQMAAVDWTDNTGDVPQLIPALRAAMGDCWHYVQVTALDAIIPRLIRRRHSLHRSLAEPVPASANGPPPTPPRGGRTGRLPPLWGGLRGGVPNIATGN